MSINPDEVNELHDYSDVDISSDSQHHTLGINPNQAAPGNHNHGIYTGSGTPEGKVTAKIGSLYLRKDGGAGTTLYVKESGTGNTGWIAK